MGKKKEIIFGKVGEAYASISVYRNLDLLEFKKE